jgi:hypothetical protein
MKPPLTIWKIGHTKNAAKNTAVSANTARAKDCDMARESRTPPTRGKVGVGIFNPELA